MSIDGAAAEENPLQRLHRETGLGEGSVWAKVLKKLVIHRGWHRLNNQHVRERNVPTRHAPFG